MGPLQGVKILDLTSMVSGPMGAMILADQGAEVIKVERLKLGDEMRRKTPEIDGTNVSFAILNRGKKSIEINLKNNFQKKKIKKFLLIMILYVT